MKNRILLLLTLMVVNLSFAQSEHFRFKKLLATDPITPVSFAIVNDGSKTIDYLVQTKVTIKYITKEWIYVTMSPALLNEAQKNGHIKQFYYEYAPPVALNDTSRYTQKVNFVHSGTGGLPAAYTGKDVIIGYVDQGLDWAHPDFKDANGHTRVLRYWDHTLPVNGQTPQPYGYGQAWDSTEIANGLCISTESGTAHGTTVAGVGSGNGLANGKNKGMAPDSKIIIVESNFNLPNWTLTIADACDYIFKVADTLGLPAVINLSLGTYLGSHDGNDPASILMENLLDEKPGRIIISAAGNSGSQGKYHVQGNISAGDTSFVWLKNNPSSAIQPNSVYFDLWADSADFHNISYAFGADKPAPGYGLRAMTSFHPGSQLGTPIFEVLKTPAGDTLSNIQIYAEIQNGLYHMEVLMADIDSTNYLYRFVTTGTGKYDMWSGVWLGANNFETNIPTISVMPSIVNYIMPDTLQSIVSSWNCSEKVISVANMRNRQSFINKNGVPYTTSNPTLVGRLSMNSSKGPSRHGVVKPDITASGDVSLSAAPLWLLNNNGYNSMVDQGGKHVVNGGTSMASPVVAGIAALYLEKCNSLTYADFKRDLINNAVKDIHTGTTPNFAFGYGKADALNTLLNGGRIEGSPVFCAGSLDLQAVAGTTVDSVHWSTGFSGNPLTVTSPGTYGATIYFNDNCQTQLTQIVTQGSVPPVPLIAPNGTTLFASTSPNYQWYLGGDTIPGATNQSLTISQGGTYTVSVTNNEGCTSYSAPYVSTLQTTILEGSEQIQLFPNPTNGVVELAGVDLNFKYNLIDSKGRIVSVAQPKPFQLDLSSLETGIYFLQIESNAHVFNIKIIRN